MLRCDNCDKEWKEEQIQNQFPDIPDLASRIEPGGVVPHGECPSCGALVYEDNQIETKVMRCNVCADLVPYVEMRTHLISHNPNAEGMDWEEVREQFQWVGTAPRTVSRIDVLNVMEDVLGDEDYEQARVELRKQIMELS